MFRRFHVVSLLEMLSIFIISAVITVVAVLPLFFFLNILGTNGFPSKASR